MFKHRGQSPAVDFLLSRQSGFEQPDDREIMSEEQALSPTTAASCHWKGEGVGPATSCANALGHGPIRWCRGDASRNERRRDRGRGVGMRLRSFAGSWRNGRPIQGDARKMSQLDLFPLPKAMNPGFHPVMIRGHCDEDRQEYGKSQIAAVIPIELVEGHGADEADEENRQPPSRHRALVLVPLASDRSVREMMRASCEVLDRAIVVATLRTHRTGVNSG